MGALGISAARSTGSSGLDAPGAEPLDGRSGLGPFTERWTSGSGSGTTPATDADAFDERSTCSGPDATRATGAEALDSRSETGASTERCTGSSASGAERSKDVGALGISAARSTGSSGLDAPGADPLDGHSATGVPGAEALGEGSGLGAFVERWTSGSGAGTEFSMGLGAFDGDPEIGAFVERWTGGSGLGAALAVDAEGFDGRSTCSGLDVTPATGAVALGGGSGEGVPGDSVLGAGGVEGGEVCASPEGRTGGSALGGVWAAGGGGLDGRRSGAGAFAERCTGRSGLGAGRSAGARAFVGAVGAVTPGFAEGWVWCLGSEIERATRPPRDRVGAAGGFAGVPPLGSAAERRIGVLSSAGGGGVLVAARRAVGGVPGVAALR
ncbi:hypothetical protein [Actinomadura chibensis]|uniref:Uncharacterized protein n=1 Tax=Actinomadura chibensis TaxID=392828 RepID=A0A5D0NI80_9ACTN|nr:hypothetical protein [Actinomadura chibensis]TYB44068.1 hypothetical protein FXF69_24230 [Actinomadura chibensis]